MSAPPCLICQKPLSPVACFDGWCHECCGRALAEVLSLRDVQGRAVVAEILRLSGAAFVAWVVENA